LNGNGLAPLRYIVFSLFFELNRSEAVMASSPRFPLFGLH
jgi:hypothetical protein